ncbi:MAG: hypothetical protein II956_14465 [Bacteroidales bacterium]|nr:hypothetical protein [Bacteroidales bacterium]
MKRVYNAIMSALQKKAAQFKVLGVNPPETFDIHLGQENNPEDFEFALPAIFYDYSLDIVGGFVYVYLYIIQDYGEDTENFATNRDNGIRFLDFITAVKRCLNNVRTTNKAYGKLELYQEQPQQNLDFYCHLLTLRCTYNADNDTDLNDEVAAEQFTIELKKGRLRNTIDD